MTATMIESSNQNTDLSKSFEVIPCSLCGERDNFWIAAGSRTDIYIKKLGLDIPYSNWSLCKECGLLFQNPRPNKVQIEKLYIQNKYFGRDYIEKLKRISIIKHRDKVAWLLDSVPEITKVHNALDLGCGIGGSIKLMNQAGIKAYGVEPDSLIAEEGRKEFGVTIKTGLFNEVDIPEGSVDLVYSNHVFEHLADPNMVVEKISKITTPNAYVFTCIPTYKKNTSLEAYAWMNLSHNYIFTKETLERLFEKFGFRTIKYNYNGAANELWLLCQKDESINHRKNLPQLKFPDFLDYYVGVPLRSLFFAPKRVKRHWSYIRDVNNELGKKQAKTELYTIVRTPLADIYRIILSLWRSLKTIVR